MTLPLAAIFLSVAVLLVLSVAASKISDRFGVPVLLVFLIIGMLAGSEGFGGIYFDNAAAAQGIGLFALAVILFSGGLDTEWESIRGVIKESLTLATLGVLLTALILGYAAHLILGISLLEGLLIGAITSSTDAAAVFALLRSQGVRLMPKIASLLEFESGSNDPMAVFLTIGMIQLILNPGQSWTSLILLFLQQMVIGGIFGILFGRLLLFLINRLRLGYEGLYPVLALGVLLLAFALTTYLQGSGILASYLLGLVLGKADFLHKRSLTRFYDGMAWLLQVVMFLTLGLLVFPSRLIAVAVPGIILASILMLIARPIAVWLCLIPFRQTAREKHFISWVGLRGAVPIILATYPRLAGLDQDGLIFNIVFFVVVSSVLVQGTGIPRMARWLKVDDRSPEEYRYPLETAPLRGWRGVLKEAVVPEGSPLAGKAIYEVRLPKNYLVVLIARGEEFVIPNGSVVLQANDRLLGLARAETHQKVIELIECPAAEGESPGEK
jgi:cell volume regulation protein A